MKTILIALMLLVSLPAFSFVHKYNGLRCDRMLHFSAGYIMTMPVTQWEKILGVEEDYGAVSVGLPFIIGYAKEVYDSREVDPRDWYAFKGTDCYYDLAAVVMGSLCAKFLTYSF